MAKLTITECQSCGTDDEDELVNAKNGYCTDCQIDAQSANQEFYDNQPY